MNLNERISALVQLGNYMMSNDEKWIAVKEKAFAANPWFIPQFIDLSVKNIATQFLSEKELWTSAKTYAIPQENLHPKKTGIVMAGNIPLVGFHDLLCTFLTGHYAVIKPSSKDEVLVKHLVEKLQDFNTTKEPYFTLAEMLKHCDAYIATGSNNSSRYFDYYFGKYPNIIRRNRTSVAILTGEETSDDLEKLGDDVHQYFGLGCRNVTKLYVPAGYDFVPLLEAFKKYAFFEFHNKFKNNYDHNLAMHILNNQYYMTNGSTVLLVENKAPFSPIAQLHYEFYTDLKDVENEVNGNDWVQCIVGKRHTPFGEAQCPQFHTFADGIDTIKFLLGLGRGEI
jgi:hypothetical protein